MILRLLLPVLSVIVFAPDLLHGQQTQGGGDAPAARADHKMYEDIEIFRRILDRKLLPLYPRINYAQSILNGGMMGMQSGMMTGMQGGMMGFQGGMMGMPGGMAMIPNNTVWHQEICRTLEGVYLKGQGVVYTATLSSLQTAVKAEPVRPQISEWESVRRQLHNEKEEAQKPAASKPAALSEVLLKILAENGRHFSRLGENESLTLVLTVRDRSPSSAAQLAVRLTGTVTGKNGSQTSASGGGDSAASKRERDLELLGDLHLKLGRAEEAITAYQKAQDMGLKMGFNRKQQAALLRKLAQAYLMLEQIEKARTMLERASSLLKEEMKEHENAKGKAPTAKPAAVALPVKMIISAPKKLLDQVGEGKISFEEFCRRASVETLTFDSHRR